VGTFDEKNGGGKSHATVPLKGVLQQFRMGKTRYGWIKHNWRRTSDGFVAFFIYNLQKHKHATTRQM
jgi:hypothetical protein